MLRGGFFAEVTFTEIRREGGSKPHRHLGRPSQKEEQRGQRRRQERAWERSNKSGKPHVLKVDQHERK